MPQKQFKQWIRAFWWNLNKCRFPQLPDGKTLLHIGCGAINSPAYINIDARKYPHVHVATGKLTSLPLFPSDKVDLIYMCHVLEHVPRAQVNMVLSEMHRLLKQGGTLRLSVPDFDRIVKIYSETGRNIPAISGLLMGGQDYQYNYHYSVFNADHLGNMLRSCGYRDVRTWDPDHCQYHDFEDWASRLYECDGKRFPVSLNLEATK